MTFPKAFTAAPGCHYNMWTLLPSSHPFVLWLLLLPIQIYLISQHGFCLAVLPTHRQEYYTQFSDTILLYPILRYPSSSDHKNFPYTFCLQASLFTNVQRYPSVPLCLLSYFWRRHERLSFVLYGLPGSSFDEYCLSRPTYMLINHQWSSCFTSLHVYVY